MVSAGAKCEKNISCLVKNVYFPKVFGIIFFSSLPFMFSLSGDFVFDDSLAVVQNKDITSNSWLAPFLNDFWGTNIKSPSSHKSYRPLTITTFRLNYVLSGKQLSATQFKVTNLLCHVTSSILLWIVLETIYKDVAKVKDLMWENVAYQSVLLFAVHPIHVEAVCGIVGRADILAAISFFLAFLIYRKAIYRQSFNFGFLLAAGLLAATAMLFKENGITALGFCLIYETINLLRKKTAKNNANLFIPSAMRILFLVIFTIFLLYGRWHIMGGMKPNFKQTDNPAYFSDNVFTKIATYNYIYVINFLLLMWPQWLCYDWSMGCIPLIKNIFDYRMIFIGIMYLYGVLTIVKLARRKVSFSHKCLHVISLSLLVVPFLPAANLFYPVGFVVAERILYISSAGYCLLLVIALKSVHYSRLTRGFNMNFVFWFIMLFYSLRSWQRSYDWQNEFKLFNSGLDVCPLNAKVHYNVAKMADAAAQREYALYEYKEAIRLYPEYSEAMNNLGNLLKDSNNLVESEFYLRKALQYKPDSAATWMNLGIVLSRLRRYDESEAAYKNSLIHRKNYPMCYYNLGNLDYPLAGLTCTQYLEMNKTGDAMTAWLQAIKLNSTHALAWTNLMALLDNTGQLEKAMELIPVALRELPDSASVNFAVANIYGKLDLYEEAEKYFKKSIKLFDKRTQAIHYSNLGVLYHRWKKLNLAAQMYKKALKINPTFESARKNLYKIIKVK